MRYLLYSLLPIISLQITPRPSICARIDVSFCCTSRIRHQCPEQCALVDCRRGFYQTLFSVDNNSDRHSKARDGQTAISKAREDPDLGNGFDHIEPPPSGTSRPVVTPSPQLGSFATLIPFEPEIDQTANVQDKDTRITTTTKRPRHHHKTPDPRIIKPPESLVNFGDYDSFEVEEEQTTTPLVQTTTTVVETTTTPVEVDTLPAFHGHFGPPSVSPTAAKDGQSVPKKLNCQVHRGKLRCLLQKPRQIPKKRNFQTSRISLPAIAEEHVVHKKKGYSRSKFRKTPEFSIAVQSVTSKPSTIEKTPTFSVDGTAAIKKPQNKLEEGLEAIINSFSMVPTNGGNLHERSKGTEFEEESSNAISYGELEPMHKSESMNRTTATPFSPSTVVIPSITSTVATPQCGVPPGFTPCVPAKEASQALLQCCRQKNLPAGCLHLCRYDITQSEVRSALDRGQCGIFSVAPFLECAARGKDNTECCRHKRIAQKTGPQCEQFCRPSHGLTALGIQHLICGNAIGDLLQCHHAGIRQ